MIDEMFQEAYDVVEKLNEEEFEKNRVVCIVDSKINEGIFITDKYSTQFVKDNIGNTIEH